MKLASLIDVFGGRCIYCRVHVVFHKLPPLPPNAATKDHDVPRCRLGSPNDPKSNEVLACFSCNSNKGDMTGPEFIAFRQTKKFAPSYVEFIEQRLAQRLRL